MHTFAAYSKTSGQLPEKIIKYSGKLGASLDYLDP